MGTNETVGEKDAARKQLKLNKETVKDLTVKKKGAADVVKGAAAALSKGCQTEATDWC